MEWAAQGGDRVTIPGGVHKGSGCGIRCRGLVDVVLLGHGLDSMIAEGFPNLIDSVIL